MIRFYKKGDLQMIEKAKKVEDLIKVFEPYPLMENDSFEKFYVDTYAARGTNAVQRMSYGLKFSLNKDMKILFMGHRGSGKSTELFLLKKEIDDQFDVISFFIEDEVDVDNLTYIDFIFAIMSQLVKYIDGKNELSFIEDDIDELYKYWKDEQIIEKVYHVSGEASGGFKSKLSFLKKVSIEGSGIFKTGAETKKTIRTKIEPKIGYLIQLINQIIKKINNKLDNNGIIFIIEDMDKLSLDAAQEIFVKYRRPIFSIKARMILTFPVFMAYNLQYNAIKEDVDMCQMLSVIKVKDQHKNELEEGIRKLKEIVYKRSDECLFSEDALKFMIIKSGGAIRDLFQMIRDSAYEALLCNCDIIKLEFAKISYLRLKSEYERLIRNEDDVAKLVSIYNEPKPLTTDEIVMSLLLRGLVLEYNGERWCGIHPAIEDFLTEKGEIK